MRYIRTKDASHAKQIHALQDLVAKQAGLIADLQSKVILLDAAIDRMKVQINAERELTVKDVKEVITEIREEAEKHAAMEFKKAKAQFKAEQEEKKNGRANPR